MKRLFGTAALGVLVAYVVLGIVTIIETTCDAMRR
jgi:hypothetical protein